MDAARGAGGYSSVQLPLIVPRIVLLVVPKTSTTVWVLILLFGTPIATATLLTTLATFLATFPLTILTTLTSLRAALILTLILRHHDLPIWISQATLASKLKVGRTQRHRRRARRH